MCLTLTSNWKENTEFYQSLDKPFVAWKVFRVDSIYKHHCTVNSVFRYYKWKNGVNVSDRANKKITDSEIRNQMVYAGIHSFLEYEDAIECFHRFWNSIVLPVKIFPKDVVATGIFFNKKSIVANKVTIRFNKELITKIIPTSMMHIQNRPLSSKKQNILDYCQEIVAKWNLAWETSVKE